MPSDAEPGEETLMASPAHRGPMALMGLCHVCGVPATRTCVACGRIACESHLAGSMPPVCSECRGGRRAPPGTRDG